MLLLRLVLEDLARLLASLNDGGQKMPSKPTLVTTPIKQEPGEEAEEGKPCAVKDETGGSDSLEMPAPDDEEQQDPSEDEEEEEEEASVEEEGDVDLAEGAAAMPAPGVDGEVGEVIVKQEPTEEEVVQQVERVQQQFGDEVLVSDVGFDGPWTHYEYENDVLQSVRPEQEEHARGDGEEEKDDS